MSKSVQSIKIKADKPVVVISVEEYESMKETIELLTSSPNLLIQLRAERREIDKGKYITLADYKAKYKLH